MEYMEVGSGAKSPRGRVSMSIQPNCVGDRA